MFMGVGGGGLSKKGGLGLGQFTDLRRGWLSKKEGVVFLRGGGGA